MALLSRMTICAMVAVFALASLCAQETRALELRMTIGVVSGRVEIMRTGGKTWRQAVQGDTVGSGDTIRSGADGICILRWRLSNLIELQPYTSLKVSNISKDLRSGRELTTVEMKNGKVDIHAKKMSKKGSVFQVKTGQAIAGVRGTRFSVETSEDTMTRVKCADGEVVVSGTKGVPVTVHGGELTDVMQGGAPSAPRSMTNEEAAPFNASGDVNAPELIVTNPSSDIDIDTASVMVDGISEQGATVTVNGIAAPMNRTGYFSTWVSLQAGENRIHIASTRGGNNASADRVVRYKPVVGAAAAEAELTILSPTDNTVTQSSFVMVSGMTNGNVPVYVNGAPAQIAEGKKSFNVRMNLDEGENVLTVTSGSGENEKKISMKIIRDTTAPFLTVWQPSVHFNVDEAGCAWDGELLLCNVTGLTEPGAKLTVNQVRCEVALDGSFNCPVELAFEKTMITVFSADAAGNQSSVILTRRIDPLQIAYIDVEVNPSAMEANGQNIAIVTITGWNFLRQPVMSGNVTLSTTSGGELSDTKIHLSNGSGVTIFTAGVGQTLNVVTITARSHSIAGVGKLTLTPLVPPDVPQCGTNTTLRTCQLMRGCIWNGTVCVDSGASTH